MVRELYQIAFVVIHWDIALCRSSFSRLGGVGRSCRSTVDIPLYSYCLGYHCGLLLHIQKEGNKDGKGVMMKKIIDRLHRKRKRVYIIARR